MNTRTQLYSVSRDVELPKSATYDTHEKRYHRRTEVVPAVVTLVWPNGFPCTLVEMYLLDIAPLLTLREYGGSLRAKAAALSHLVRYCWNRRLNLWELHDAEFRDFIEYLSEELRVDRPTLRRRNRNTVRALIEECLAFFSWLQSNIIRDRTIVGPRDSNPQIRLLPKKTSGYLGAQINKFVYAYTPPPDPTDPTGPIPSAIRNKLWDALLTKADPTIYTARFKSRYKDDFLKELTYLLARRELMLLLLEATGARPGELVRLSLSKNERCSSANRIIIPTLKRRRGKDPERSVPISGEVALKIELFIEKHRRALLERRMRRAAPPRAVDRLLLTIEGTPMSELTLTKDFQRIVALTKLNQRVCPSMFRHRFITIMVARHLTDFMSAAPGRNAALITESDYRTILRKVATFTGHAREESLFRYIDWAWEEVGVFRETKNHVSIEPAEDDVAFTALIAELQLEPNITAQEVIKKAKAILNRVRAGKLNASHGNGGKQ